MGEVSQLPKQESLTLDEERALELFEALKSKAKRAKLVQEEGEESTEDEDSAGETPAPPANNTDVEALEDGEDDERRGITCGVFVFRGFLAFLLDKLGPLGFGLECLEQFQRPFLVKSQGLLFWKLADLPH